MVAMIIMMLTMTRESVTRINEVLDEVPDITDNGSTFKVENGEIEFRHVNFSYSGKNDNLTLSDINLHIRAGETIGVVGGTGDGKSTLMQLIPRFYDALSGEVLVGGRNVKDYSLYELRESVSMVLQKNMLFSGTIRDNLRWGNKDATDEQIEHACRLACAHDFVMSFPDGYDTDLGQGGVNVSGGQKQRLCIARALLKNPKILILDDSTSAVDSRTDESIRAAFRESLPGTTKLIIAQRIASIMYSDRIIVMDKGRISDVGTHDELMQRSEIYREVYLSQNKELPQEGGTVSGVNSSSDIKGKEAVTNARRKRHPRCTFGRQRPPRKSAQNNEQAAKVLRQMPLDVHCCGYYDRSLFPCNNCRKLHDETPCCRVGRGRHHARCGTGKIPCSAYRHGGAVCAQCSHQLLFKLSDAQMLRNGAL